MTDACWSFFLIFKKNCTYCSMQNAGKNFKVIFAHFIKKIVDQLFALKKLVQQIFPRSHEVH